MSDYPPPPPPPPPGPMPIDYRSPAHGPAYLGPAPTKEERTLGMMCHLLTLCGYVIPFGNIIAPLILWVVKKDQSPFVDDQGKESLNFQITVTIAAVVAGLSMFICIGFVLLPAVAIASLVLEIIAAVKANEGVAYRYPLTIRFL